MSHVTIEILGHPAPGGSKRAFFNQKAGRAVVVDTCKRNMTWREDVRAAAIPIMDGKPLMTGPLSVVATFYLKRPKSHYRTGKYSNQLKPEAPKYHTCKPDGTKLFRSTEDALTGIVWKDDAQVAFQCVRKLWGEKSGAVLEIEEFQGETNAHTAREQE